MVLLQMGTQSTLPLACENQMISTPMMLFTLLPKSNGKTTLSGTEKRSRIRSFKSLNIRLMQPDGFHVGPIEQHLRLHNSRLGQRSFLLPLSRQLVGEERKTRKGTKELPPQLLPNHRDNNKDRTACGILFFPLKTRS